MDPLTKTWGLLVGLTLATTLLAGFEGAAAGLGILGLAFLKARLILGRFLQLAAAPGWLAVFAVPVGVWLLLIGVGYAIVLR